MSDTTPGSWLFLLFSLPAKQSSGRVKVWRRWPAQPRTRGHHRDVCRVSSGGFWGSLVATIGIFLPSFLLILFVAPILVRHRENPNVQGFIKGAYSAAIGTILGAYVLLSKIAVGDWLTVLITIGWLEG